MKKTLVALAAVAATASFAQSSVVLSGNFDVAGSSSTGTLARAQGTTFSTLMGTSSTTSLKITATEDLGGGMKAMAMYELDPRSLINDSTALTLTGDTATSAAASSSVRSTLTGLSRHEAYVGLSGGFGTIKLGAANSPSLDVNGASSPLGTGIGSAYTANGGTNTNWSSMMNTRYSRSFKYESPVINGFQFSAQYAPGNDQTNSTTSTPLSIPNNRQGTEIGLKYSVGNLNLAYANVAQAAQTNATGWYVVGAAGPYAATNTNALGANYQMSNITVYAGVMNGNLLAATTIANTASAMRGAIKANFGNVDVMAQYTEVTANTGTSNANVTQKTTGARIDYNLSKTAAAYIGYEAYDSGASSANQQNLTSIGLRDRKSVV